MTKKDYIWLADHLRCARQRQINKSAECVVICTMTREMATDLKRQNPRFDRAKFLEACNVKD